MPYCGPAPFAISRIHSSALCRGPVQICHPWRPVFTQYCGALCEHAVDSLSFLASCPYETSPQPSASQTFASRPRLAAHSQGLSLSPMPPSPIRRCFRIRRTAFLPPISLPRDLVPTRILVEPFSPVSHPVLVAVPSVSRRVCRYTHPHRRSSPCLAEALWQAQDLTRRAPGGTSLQAPCTASRSCTVRTVPACCPGDTALSRHAFR